MTLQCGTTTLFSTIAPKRRGENGNNPHTRPARMKPAQALHIPKGVMVGGSEGCKQQSLRASRNHSIPGLPTAPRTPSLVTDTGILEHAKQISNVLLCRPTEARSSEVQSLALKWRTLATRNVATTAADKSWPARPARSRICPMLRRANATTNEVVLAPRPSARRRALCLPMAERQESRRREPIANPVSLKTPDDRRRLGSLGDQPGRPSRTSLCVFQGACRYDVRLHAWDCASMQCLPVPTCRVSAKLSGSHALRFGAGTTDASTLNKLRTGQSDSDLPSSASALRHMSRSAKIAASLWPYKCHENEARLNGAMCELQLSALFPRQMCPPRGHNGANCAWLNSPSGTSLTASPPCPRPRFLLPPPLPGCARTIGRTSWSRAW